MGSGIHLRWASPVGCVQEQATAMIKHNRWQQPYRRGAHWKCRAVRPGATATNNKCFGIWASQEKHVPARRRSSLPAQVLSHGGYAKLTRQRKPVGRRHGKCQHGPGIKLQKKGFRVSIYFSPSTGCPGSEGNVHMACCAAGACQDKHAKLC